MYRCTRNGSDFTTNPELGDRPSAALAALDAPAAYQVAKYDHVLVDEAQDFPTSALQLCVRLLAEGSTSLLVVADAAQNIFRNDFTWKAAGINAAGRTRVLNVGYRNTREVLEFAHDFLMRGGDVRLDAGADSSDESAVIPPILSTRHGPVPLFLLSDSPQLECLRIAEHCAERIAKGSSPGSIAGPLRRQLGWPLRLDDHAAEGVRACRLAIPLGHRPERPDRQGHPRRRPGAGRPEHDLLGQGPGVTPRRALRHLRRPTRIRSVPCRLIYVGMTRATEEVAISRSGEHRYMVDMER